MMVPQGRLQPAGPAARHADPARPVHFLTLDEPGLTTDGKRQGAVTGGETRKPDLDPGIELGRCYVDEEWLSVHFHTAQAMWLCRDGDFKRTVGLIRWDMGKSPQLILDTRDERFDHSYHPNVVAMVDLAMAVWWCVVDGRPLDPMLPVAIHPAFAAFVVYWSRCSRPDLDFPRSGNQ